MDRALLHKEFNYSENNLSMTVLVRSRIFMLTAESLCALLTLDSGGMLYRDLK